MDEEPVHPTTNHPVFGLGGYGVTSSLTEQLMNSTDTLQELAMRANISNKYSMPKTDYGRVYKVNINLCTKNDITGYLQDQTETELRATHIMKNYPVYSRAPGRTCEVEDFYMDLQHCRNHVKDRKRYLTQPMMMASSSMATLNAKPTTQLQVDLDKLYRDAKSSSEDVSRKKREDFLKQLFR